MAINIVVPELGESVVEATVLHWLKQQGEAVQAGETLVELETEKVNLDVSAPAAGVLSRIAHPDGTDVKIGDVLGEIEPTKAGASPTPTAPPPAARKRGSEGERESAAQQDVSGDGKQAEPATPEIKATPVAQRLAQESGVDLRQVTPSAPDQRVTKQDVEAYLVKQKSQAPVANREAPATSPQSPISNLQSPPADREKRVRMSRRRQTIARRLVEAQQTAAMLTTFNEVDMTAVMDLRKRHKESFKARHGISLGLTSFFVPAVIGALKAFPQVNAEIQGDEIVYKEHYDIGIAVGAEDGLVVPVLRDADRLSFPEIEKKIREFGEKAQNGTLALNDLRGGTFTITNGGVYGSLLSTPILNPPQVGILGLHKIQERPVAHEGQVVIRPMMYVALSYDHRLVDGREAVQFLVRVKELIEDPGALLLEG